MAGGGLCPFCVAITDYLRLGAPPGKGVWRTRSVVPSSAQLQCGPRGRWQVLSPSKRDECICERGYMEGKQERREEQIYGYVGIFSCGS